MALDRRGFLKFVAGASAGVMATPIPWKLLDDVSIWTQNWPWIPSNVDGETTYVSTVSKLCPSGVGMKVRMVGDRPCRVLPDPAHPLSLGGISSLAVAEVQMLYSPARVKRPLKRSGDGTYVAISWQEAAQMLEKNLGAAKGSIACVSGDDTGTINEVLSGMLRKAGSEDFYLMPGEAQAAAKALNLMGGEGQFAYNIEDSDYVLAIGANILESWGTVIRNRAAYHSARPHDGAPESKYVYAGPVQNNTAAGADEWMPVKPGTEGVIALGIAHLLIKAGASADAYDFGRFASLAAKYDPKTVAAETGVDPKQLTRIAQELLKAKRPVVLTGSEFDQGTGVSTILAGTAVNMLLGGVSTLPVADKVVAAGMTRAEMLDKDLVAYLSRVHAGKVSAPKALLFYEANPAYALPQAKTMADMLAKVPFKVSFSTFMDETAALCDLVLPVPMGLERLDDVNTPYGSGQIVYGLSRPVTQAPDEIKPAADVIMMLADKLGYGVGFGSFEEVLKAKADAVGADWDSLFEGETFTADATPPAGLAMRADIIANGLKTGDRSFPFAVAPVHKLNVGTPKTAIPPYNNKTIRRWELQKDECYVMMNGATARKIGASKHDRVVLSNNSGRIAARVNIFEGVMTDTVAVLMGLGHTAFDKFSKGKGENVMELLTVGYEPGTGLSVWNTASVNIEKA